MDVILKEDVKNLGKAGQVVKVSEGFARNFLFPANKAVVATENGVKAIQESVKRKEEKSKEEENKAREAAAKLIGKEVTIRKKAAEDNRLFGSVAEGDIAAEINKLGFSVDKSMISMPKHIKETGHHEVVVKFGHAIEARVKLNVERETGKK